MSDIAEQVRLLTVNHAHEVTALRAEIERLRADLSSASMGNAAVAATRDLLRAQDVPEAAYIDDHVANAIAQRNQAREEIERLRAENADLAHRLVLGEAAHAAIGSMLLDVQDDCIKERQRAEDAARSMRERADQALAELPHNSSMSTIRRVVAALPLIEEPKIFVVDLTYGENTP